MIRLGRFQARRFTTGPSDTRLIGAFIPQKTQAFRRWASVFQHGNSSDVESPVVEKYGGDFTKSPRVPQNKYPSKYQPRVRNAYTSDKRPREYYIHRRQMKRNNNRNNNISEDMRIINRNEVKESGEEGTGLMDVDDYDRVTDLKDISMDNLKSEGEEKSGLSGVETLTLRDHKILSAVLVNSLHYNRKYTQLTPVQAASLIPLLQDENAVVRAKTGTGKTGAFAIPLLQKVYDAKKRGERGVKGVIVSPTRELAQQIADEITSITSFGTLRSIRTVSFVGGLSKGAQIFRAFGNGHDADIIVGTPGRLMDILQDPMNLNRFSSLKVKIFDEADRLFDFGFKDQLEEINQALDGINKKNELQTMLFSATIDNNILRLAESGLGKPTQVIDTVPADEPEAQELVDQTSVVCPNFVDMYETTVSILRSEEDLLHKQQKNFKSIVFMPTVSSASHFTNVLAGIMGKNRVTCINGKMTQAQRQKASDRFKAAVDHVLVTTDVIARGMDFPNVTDVVQFGSPQDTNSYIHRIGRTARIGNRGKSFLVLCEPETSFLKSLEKIKIKMNNYEKYEPNEVIRELLKRQFHRISFRQDVLPGEAFGGLLNYYSMMRSIGCSFEEFMEQNLQPFLDLVDDPNVEIDTHIARRNWAKPKPSHSSRGRGHFQQNSRGFNNSRGSWGDRYGNRRGDRRGNRNGQDYQRSGKNRSQANFW